ncbi:sensor histidine kinase [Microbulbifer yueqingensis]|uniref:histidine kinase n=1 Tax=Microbulbifer yueqingensis TaxID=658219 RepID=A0A1G8VS99_9GAMM|nr:ATP-binding protein [Microbulbifer yueqingensis]SDJ68737.1 PAS domain-containing protein [Microbulbifer yueqingensis]
MRLQLSLEARLFAVGTIAVLVGATLPQLLQGLGAGLRLGWSAGLAAALVVLVLLLRLVIRPLNQTLQALEGGLLNFRDGDFSVSLAIKRNDELGRLALLYNDAGEILRRERAHIYQRELLLDTMIQSSPHTLLLVDQGGHIIYANASARHLLHRGKPITGMLLADLLETCPPELGRAIRSGEDGLYNYSDEHGGHSQHVSNSVFVLNAQRHRLVLIREMTRELTRAEVQVWKKVIRLISHELNNSLAPISSMAHSGKLLARQPDKQEMLERVFDTIAERCQHLTEFTQGYARFAKLPAPSREEVDWKKLIERIEPLHHFTLYNKLPSRPGFFDPVQIEQALLNLFKNAAEAGSSPEDTELEIRADRNGQTILVRDRGAGMGEKVLQQALLPFYSTKPDGMGLGLALCREIVEAHEGNIQLHNRAGGGLQVSLFLPWPQSPQP